MKSLFLSFGFLVALAVSAQTTTDASKHKSASRYLAPDRIMEVLIVPIGRQRTRTAHESRVEFHSADGSLVCAVDYSSKDSEHGFGVVKAAWTPDSQYFVFSLTSSGGHQAWRSPTDFYSRKSESVRSVDDFFEAEIAKSDFSLIPPNTVRTELWEDKNVPVSVVLDNPPEIRSWRRNNPLDVKCMAGTISKVDEP